MRDFYKRFLPFASLIALFVVLSLASPYFLTVGNLSSVARQTTVITIMASWPREESISRLVR
jgi:ribose/xylose/arabinose/galactoside ABC-type transport system permease subunit